MENVKLLTDSFRNELNNILTYWEQHTVDLEEGGFYGRLTEDDRVVTGAIKGAVLNARILYSFSAAYRLTGNARYRKLAERSLRYIKEYFMDPLFGGVYWSVSHNGQAVDTKKQIYAIAFTVYGLAEYARATGDTACLEWAKGLYVDIEKYSFDAAKGGYLEALTREWQEIADQRLSDKDANEKKTMNTHLHILEAYTNLYRVWPDETLGRKIRGLIDVFINHIIDPNTFHLVLFFNEDWERKSDIISYGHDIEASWLLAESAEVLGDQTLLRSVRAVAVKIALASMEGLLADGSMIYEFDLPADRRIKERHWWVQAEAMVGFLHAAQLTGELGESGELGEHELTGGTPLVEGAHFFQHFQALWDFTRQHIIDRQHGEWFWGINGDGSLMKGQDKAGFWKCPYHNSRACIEIINRLKNQHS